MGIVQRTLSTYSSNLLNSQIQKNFYLRLEYLRNFINRQLSIFTLSSNIFKYKILMALRLPFILLYVYVLLIRDIFIQVQLMHLFFVIINKVTFVVFFLSFSYLLFSHYFKNIVSLYIVYFSSFFMKYSIEDFSHMKYDFNNKFRFIISHCWKEANLRRQYSYLRSFPVINSKKYNKISSSLPPPKKN